METRKESFTSTAFGTEPESVVFSSGSYDRLKTDLHTKAILEAIRTLKTVVFVGCGAAGMGDSLIFAALWIGHASRTQRSHRHEATFWCLNDECPQFFAGDG